MNTLTASILRFLLGAATVLATFDASAVDSDCVHQGGKSHCSAITEQKKWEYVLCDDQGAYLNRMILWCRINGGSWGEPGPTCRGGSEVTEGNAESRAENFEQEIHNACYIEHSSGSWGMTYSSWNCPSSTGKKYVNGIEYHALKVFGFQGKYADAGGNCNQPWSENVVLVRNRDVGCASGFSNRTGADGSTECTVMPPCNECVGNPIDMGSGAKRMVEVDYQSPIPGGVSVIRYYNSLGYFDTKFRQQRNNDFWRTNWSSSIFPYTHPDTGALNNQYVSGGLVRPDGTVMYFDRWTGKEITDVAGKQASVVIEATGGVPSKWTVTTAEGDVEIYRGDDKIAWLTSITKRDGQVYTLTYGSGGLASVTDPMGRVTLISEAGFTTPKGEVYTYTYDADARLEKVTYPDLSFRRYWYEDTRHRWALTGVTNELGVRYATYGYNAAGLAISTEHAGETGKFTVARSEGLGVITTIATDSFGTAHGYNFTKIGGVNRLTNKSIGSTFAESRTYTPEGILATVKDRRGNETQYTFDVERMLETSRTETAGPTLSRTIQTTWHPTLRLPATITEPLKTTAFTYDAVGYLTKLNVTAGTKVREWNVTVNTRGQPLTIDGPRTDVSDVTTFTYYPAADACTACRAQVKTVTNPLGHVTTFDAYDQNGAVTQVTDPNGVVSAISYDNRRRVTNITVGGEGTSFEYDVAGNLQKASRADGSFVRYFYDGANRLYSVEDRLGNSIEYALDAMGNRITETVFDAQNEIRMTMQRVYNSVNLLHKTLNAASEATTYAWGDDGLLSTRTDALNRATGYAFDGFNRMTSMTDPVGTTSFTYDANDRLTSVKDPKQLTTTYNNDGLGNLMHQVSPDTNITLFTHDAAGNTLTQTDGRMVVTTYAYDALNRVTSASVTDGSVTYEYDNTSTGGAYAKGRLTRITDPSGSTSFTYDALGRITAKSQVVSATPSNRTFNVGYAFTSGRQSGMTYPSGNAVSYGFDLQGQITSISYGGSAVVGSIQYLPFGGPSQWTWANSQLMKRTYNLDGRVKSLTLGPSTGIYPDLSQVFGYDAVNRLTSANLAAGQVQGFTYDATSNRLTSTLNAASTTYTYPPDSHRLSSLTGATSRTFDYDGSGNVTSTLGVTYTYDGRGRMKQAGAVTYLVNGLGQRVKKGGISDIYFVYDEAGHLIGEYDGNGSMIQETVWLGDTPVAVVKPASPSGFGIFYIWSDHLNTPRMISDASSTVRWEWPHNDPFGNNLPNEDPAGGGQFAYNLRFPGQYFDAETGKHYNYFRDYDPGIGRYVESDPIGLRGGLNTYGYVSGNPVRDVDPKGLVNWNGVFGGASASAGAGGGVFGFQLTSECKCGRRVTITGFASSGTVGGGARYSGTASSAQFYDYKECPDVGIANGLFTMASAGITIGGGGLSYQRVEMGGLRSQSYPGPDNINWGFDVSFGLYMGASAVTQSKVESCCNGR